MIIVKGWDFDKSIRRTEGRVCIRVCVTAFRGSKASAVGGLVRTQPSQMRRPLSLADTIPVLNGILLWWTHFLPTLHIEKEMVSMDEWMDKTILLGFGFLLVLNNTHGYKPVIALLAAITAAALGIYVENRIWKRFLFAAMFLITCIFPLELFFSPVFLYDIVGYVKRTNGYDKVPLHANFIDHPSETIPYIAASVPFLLFFSNFPKDATTAVFWLLMNVLSVLLAYRTKQKQILAEKLIHIRDSGVELNRMLEERNKELLEKQDYEIHLATLRERNRIAREIHDHVGHMLSRSLLLTGALLTVEKEGAVHEQLLHIRETLDAAMDNIRRSVHDLHEDSVDLRHSMEELLEPMRKDYTAVLDYDMSDRISRQVKYAMIAVAKEALSNTMKHSAAERIWLRCREHPGFYQLSIEDDGTAAAVGPMGSGLGLLNMKERVDALGGTFHVHTQTGFQVFVTIPKREEMECG